MHKFAIVAISGLAISAISLGIAGSMAARSGKIGMDLSWFDDLESCKTTNATATSRQFNWDGGDEVSVAVPVNLHYKPGQGTQVVVGGDPELLSHVKVHNGDIELNCSLHHWHHQRLDVTLPGNKTFREINLKGLADADLQDINQPELELAVAGSASVTATGKTDNLKLDIAGRGDVHARDLIAKKVEVNVAGRGDVETSPQDSVDISIAGSGDVKLYSEPKHVDTSIMGSGNVEHLAPKG
jgi:Putative auto-transporter adhesin, head GIN domain